MAEDVVQVKIESIAAGGAGLARHGDKNIFIEGVVPGETVVCRITEDRRFWSRAQLLEISESSPDRVTPVCAFYGECGGCNLQHMNYPSQLAAKKIILRDAFSRIGGIDPPELRVFPSSPLEYRNRMQFHCVRPNLQYGLKAKKSDGIITVSDCPVADPGIRNFLRKENGRSFSPPPEKDRFTVYARGGLFLSEGGVQRGKTRILDRELLLDAGVFFQSNGMMLEKMLADLRETVSGIGGAARNLPLADLYCGVGTFAVFLGEFFPRADLVEENKTALALARENLLASAAAPAEFFARRSEDRIKNADIRRYGFIVADPPRQGLAPALSRKLATNGPPFFAYVSCDPATLARDSKILTEGVYRLAELNLYDFYPQTAHIESLAVFVRR